MSKSTLPSPKERAGILNERRNLKMARSAHAYVRGNTLNFYEWLESVSGKAVPQGPAVWICGDCHMSNLGPLADTKGHIRIQIRDLDQTVIGNPAHDLIRLGLSLTSAARGSDLSGIITVRMCEQLMEGYEQAFAKDAQDEIELPEAVEKAMKTAIKRKWKHLARERIKDERPSIPLGNTFWPLSKDEREEIVALFTEEKVRRLVTSLRSRDSDASVEVLDAAYWVKGCSSLGNLRYAVLLGVGEKGEEQCLIDIKEAVKAVAPAYDNVKMPRNNAERVVEGAWHLSPALGERMLAASLQGRSVFMRELLPQDLKLDIEHLTPDEAMKVSKYLGAVVGKAHARQMDEETRAGWHRELNANRSKTLNAPSWLWRSIVELILNHEGAYLEHCRKYVTLGT